jgi:hypothetical protein
VKNLLQLVLVYGRFCIVVSKAEMSMNRYVKKTRSKLLVQVSHNALNLNLISKIIQIQIRFR